MLTESSNIITVITPVYNCGQVIKETAASLLAQTTRQFEWLLVNDGSIDPSTISILDELALSIEQVRIINVPWNKGLPAARNAGIREAKGKYVFFLDADDLIDPTFFEKALLFLELNPGFAFVNSYVRGFGELEYEWQGGFHDRELFLDENRNTSCFMARREVFNTVLFDESMTDGCEDWEFWLHAASRGFWGYTLPEYLFHYRRTATSKWAAMKGQGELEEVKNRLVAKYGGILSRQGFPSIQKPHYQFGESSPGIAFSKRGSRVSYKHLFCIFPWLEVGGADQFNLQLLAGLKAKGWTFTIITTMDSDHPLHKEFNLITKDIFHLSNLGRENNFPSYIRYIIENRQPSGIFLSNSMYGYYLLPWLKQQFPDLPVTDYVHCEDPSWYNGGYPFFSTRYAELLDKTYVTSEQLRNWCIAHGADGDKVEVCYINIDEQRIRKNESNGESVRQQLGIDPGSCLIIYVARLTRQKQPDVLVRVLANLKKRGLQYKCLVIGDGPEKASLLDHIERAGIRDNVIYAGVKDNSVTMEYMDAADIFFLPSLYEGIALSIYEAMAKELAIVGAATGGQPELVTPGCGFLIQKKSPAQEVRDYTSALELLVKNPSLAREMGKAGRLRVEEHFSIGKMIDQMDGSLASVKAARPSKAGIDKAYLLILNRMLHLEKANADLKVKTDSKAMRFLLKHENSYKKVKRVYHKVKRILTTNTSK